MEHNEFLKNYLIYTSGNETPEVFHTWMGIACISGAVERRVWVPRGFSLIPLGMYILLAGNPGIVSKSSCLDLGTPLLEEIGASVFTGATSKRKFVDDMCQATRTVDTPEGQFEHCSITAACDELNTLLGSGGPEMEKFLVEMFSRTKKYEDKSRNAGSFLLPNPSLNIVACVVPHWFGNNMANNLSSTGLLARFIILYATEPRGSFPDPVVTPQAEAARQKCLEILFNLTSFYGPMTKTEGAVKYFEDWYNNYKIEYTEDYRMIDYLVRKKRAHVPKLAAIMALGDLRMEIQEKDYRRAIEQLDRVDDMTRQVYVLSGSNKFIIHMGRVNAILKAHKGKCELKLIMQILMSDFNIQEIRLIVEQLQEAGIVKMHKEGGKVYLIAKEDK